MQKNLFIFLFSLFAVAMLITAGIVFASTTDGTIEGYVWGEKIGWINFGATNGNAHITDSVLTGYVWSDNFGWIKLNPTTSGVTNNSEGTLAGYAWSQNLGWINFSGVVVNSSGYFTGTATGDNTGTVNFSCANCNVHTDWRPASARVSCGDGTCNGTETCNTCPSDCGGCGNPGPRHNECNASLVCITVDGAGTDQCQTSANCVSHKECSNFQCIVVDTPGLDLCAVNADCPSHKACNAQQQCVIVAGTGSDSCQINADCTASHNACILRPLCTGCPLQMQCVAMHGAGVNQCQTVADCSNITHNECSNFQCIAVAGVGINQCQTSIDCQLQLHNECNEQNQCVIVTGAGSNQCLTDQDCIIYHNECNSENKCVPIMGAGINQCQSDANCVQGRHNECDSQNQCVSVLGVGADQCQTTDDCNIFHNECNSYDNKCYSVRGVGVDQCQTNSDCSVAGSHNECNQQGQCVSVFGISSNQCQTNNDCFISGGQTHNECDSQNQCVSVAGGGISQCIKSEDCKDATVPLIIPGGGIIDEIEPIVEDVKVVAQEIKKIVETPQGAVATKVISTTGVAVTAAATAVTFVFSPLSLFELVLIPFRLLGLLLAFFGFKKRNQPWGVVYDSVTKQPLDPVYVVLKDLLGKDIASAISDIDGRYGFLIGKGIFKILAQKSNYIFPSKKLLGLQKDEFYDNLYFGENIEIKEGGGVIAKNIPMDPVNFDWNEFAKKDKKLMRFYSEADLVLRKISDIFFVIGFIVALIAFFAAPYPYNTIIATAYFILLLLRFLGLKPKSYGNIQDKITGDPMSFAIIRVFMAYTDREITRKVADKYGRYYCLVPPGRYYIKVENKNNDGSYSLIYVSETIDVVKKGIIKTKFLV